MRRVTGILMMIGLLVFGCVGYFAGSAHLLRPSLLAAADDCQSFPQTGFQACGDFLNYWNTHGGLAQQGYPISPPFQEKSDTDGKTYTVQYFERAVFEAHPENQPPNNVLLSLLGSQKYKAKYPNGAPASAASSPVVPTASAVSGPAASKFPLRTVNGPLALTLWDIRDPAPNDRTFLPKAGNRIVAFDITVENTGTGTIHFNSLESSVQTTDDRVYDTGFSFSALTPTLNYGDLAPGK
jgi:hypothetical protein